MVMLFHRQKERERERNSQSGGVQSSFSLHRSALMAARAASRALIPAQPRARARIKAALLARDAARVSACGSHSRVLELVTASHWYARTAFVLVDGSPRLLPAWTPVSLAFSGVLYL